MEEKNEVLEEVAKEIIEEIVEEEYIEVVGDTEEVYNEKEEEVE